MEIKVRERRLSSAEITKLVDDKIQLTDYQRSVVCGDYFEWPFDVFEDIHKEFKSNVLWRLSAILLPFAVLFTILTVMPLRYLFTGRGYFKKDNRYYLGLKLWCRKAGWYLVD